MIATQQILAAQISPAMMLIVNAKMIVLKKNDKTPWSKLNRRIVRDVTSTSDTWLVIPMTKEK